VEGSALQKRTLVYLALAELLAMTLWFSASADVPALKIEWELSTTGVAWLTMSVQIGFVVGTFLSAFLSLPDVMSARKLLAASALLGAATNAGFAFFADGIVVGVALRFMTGVFLAGVYPPGMKLAATWTRKYRGLAIGLLVGALTVGSASPHLVRSLTDIRWESVVLVSSVLALAGGAIVFALVREGPFGGGKARFEPRVAMHAKPSGRVIGEPGVPRPHVGAVCDVDMGAGLPG